MKQAGLTKTYLGTPLKHSLRQVDTVVQANTGRVLNLNTGNMLKHISITFGEHRGSVKT